MAAFAERATRELQATGETARKRSSAADVTQLTAQRAQVARRARDGLSNSEIGVRLFISRRTLQYHLRKVFTKLVSSRAASLIVSCPTDQPTAVNRTVQWRMRTHPPRPTMTPDITTPCRRITPVSDCERAMDELLATDEPAVGQLDEFSGDAAPYAAYQQLAAEQAALRRLATLAARGVEPSEIFDAVTREMSQCVPAEAAGLWRYETTGEITLVAGGGAPVIDVVVSCRRPSTSSGSGRPVCGP